MNTAFVAGFSAVRPSVVRPNLCASKAFFGTRASPVRSSSSTTVRMAVVLPVFTRAMTAYKEQYPLVAKYGWGATVKAERWNGRHAMFGLLAILLTGYCKGHGLIPDPTTILDLSQWGSLARMGNTGANITNERAIILIAHVHVFLVSLAATIAPFSFQDQLLLKEGEQDEEPAGLFPPFSVGLTKDAELWNCRVAMLGLCSLVGVSVSTGTPILDVMNIGLGKILF